MSLKNPVKYPVKYYSHLDTDAPQLADVEGCIKTILKACLVIGYGTGADEKQAAGWEMPFEDDYRIVLRRPLKTGNPPDIKIENGTFDVDGTPTTRHRIASYAANSCTSLDDDNELASVNLLARDSKCGDEWHLIVSDFGLVLCYQMGENNTGNRNNLILLTSFQKLDDATEECFIVNKHLNFNEDGYAKPWTYGILANQVEIYDLKTNQKYSEKHYLSLSCTETQINNDYFAQNIIMSELFLLPFFCSFSKDYNNDLTTKQISINNRQMLRYINAPIQRYSYRAFYIPLDYWEL